MCSRLDKGGEGPKGKVCETTGKRWLARMFLLIALATSSCLSHDGKIISHEHKIMLGTFCFGDLCDIYFWSLSTDEEAIESISNALLVNNWDPEGLTPLHFAVRASRNSIVAEALLAKGADPNRKDINKNTPLHFAAKYNDSEVIRALVAGGADINDKNINGYTPLHLAIRPVRYSSSKHRDIDRVQTFRTLIELGADINSRAHDGSTPSHRAAQQNKPELLFLLLEAGANIYDRTRDGNTLLHFVAGNIADSLALSTLVDLGVDINIRNVRGRTPLHLAAANETSSEPLLALIEAGAEVNAVSKDGHTALHDVFRYWQLPLRTKEKAWALLEAGANIDARTANGMLPIDLIPKELYDTELYHQLAIAIESPSSSQIP